MNIYGASGHAKVIIDIAKSKDILIDSIFDDNKDLKEISGFKVKHTISSEALKNKFIIAIGNNTIRKKVVLDFEGEIHPALIHESAVISSNAVVGKGTVIMSNASVNSDSTIGEHCIVNTGSSVEHDCILGNFVHISPNAALAGGVEIGEGTHVGIGAVVIPGVKIGKWATIGAGAVILKDIPDNVVVVGNPGRIIKNKKL